MMKRTLSVCGEYGIFDDAADAYSRALFEYSAMGWHLERGSMDYNDHDGEYVVYLVFIRKDEQNEEISEIA